jgi:hypothetical protein
MRTGVGARPSPTPVRRFRRPHGRGRATRGGDAAGGPRARSATAASPPSSLLRLLLVLVVLDEGAASRASPRALLPADYRPASSTHGRAFELAVMLGSCLVCRALLLGRVLRDGRTGRRREHEREAGAHDGRMKPDPLPNASHANASQYIGLTNRGDARTGAQPGRHAARGTLAARASARRALSLAHRGGFETTCPRQGAPHPPAWSPPESL